MPVDLGMLDNFDDAKSAVEEEKSAVEDGRTNTDDYEPVEAKEPTI